MKDKLLPVVLCVVSAVLAHAASVSGVRFSQDPGTRKVTITYNLDEDAIITMDVCTNGTASGVKN